MAETFDDPVEVLQEKLHKLDDFVHPSMPDRFAMPISEGLLVIKELWHVQRNR